MIHTSKPSIYQLIALGFAVFLLAACGSDESSLPPVQTTSSVPDDSPTSTTSVASSITSASSTTTEGSAITTSTTPPPNTEPCLPAAEPVVGAEYRVFNVEGDDVLNIRELPGHETTKVGALGPTTSGLRPTGYCRMVGAGVWWELDTSGTGAWVNSKFLTTD